MFRKGCGRNSTSNHFFFLSDFRHEATRKREIRELSSYHGRSWWCIVIDWRLTDRMHLTLRVKSERALGVAVTFSRATMFSSEDCPYLRRRECVIHRWGMTCNLWCAEGRNVDVEHMVLRFKPRCILERACGFGNASYLGDAEIRQ